MKSMKNLVALSLIGLMALTGCSSNNGKQGVKQDLSMYNEGDELVEQAEFEKAKEKYSDIIKEYKKKSNYSEEIVSEGLIKIAECDVKMKNSKGLEHFKKHTIKEFTDKPSKKLMDYVEMGDGSKRWFKIEGFTDSSRGHNLLEFKYDDKGRIIYSSEMYYVRPEYSLVDNYPYYYEYTDDGLVRINTVEGKEEGSKGNIKLTVDDNNIITKEDYYTSSGEYSSSREYKYSLVGPEIHHGVEIYMENGYLSLQKTVNGTKLDTSFENKFDNYKNLIETYIYSSYENKPIHKYYKYVFCKPSDLKGDLSELPTSCSDMYNMNKELWW